MSEVIKTVVDTVDEMEYQAELERATKEISQHKWISNPQDIAKYQTDFKFGRISRSELIPLDWNRLNP